MTMAVEARDLADAAAALEPAGTKAVGLAIGESLPLGIDLSIPGYVIVASATYDADGVRIAGVSVQPVANGKIGQAVSAARMELDTDERRCVLALDQPDADLVLYPHAIPASATERDRRNAFRIAAEQQLNSTRIVSRFVDEGTRTVVVAARREAIARVRRALRGSGLQVVAIDFMRSALRRVMTADALVQLVDDGVILTVFGDVIEHVHFLAQSDPNNPEVANWIDRTLKAEAAEKFVSHDIATVAVAGTKDERIALGRQIRIRRRVSVPFGAETIDDEETTDGTLLAQALALYGLREVLGTNPIDVNFLDPGLVARDLSFDAFLTATRDPLVIASVFALLVLPSSVLVVDQARLAHERNENSIAVAREATSATNAAQVQRVASAENTLTSELKTIQANRLSGALASNEAARITNSLPRNGTVGLDSITYNEAEDAWNISGRASDSGAVGAELAGLQHDPQLRHPTVQQQSLDRSGAYINWTIIAKRVHK